MLAALSFGSRAHARHPDRERPQSHGVAASYVTFRGVVGKYLIQKIIWED